MRVNHNRTRSIAFANSDDSFLSSTKLVVVMCGLPARGKSYISQKIRRYLNWMGVSAKDFNVGTHRRKTLTCPQNHKFFSQESEENTNIRNKLAMDVLEELIDWLKSGGHVGIIDATNTTRQRRDLILKRISKEQNMEVLFIESILTKSDIIDQNIELKLYSPDYRGQDKQTALQDFRERLKSYEIVYEPLDEKYDSDLTYIKLVDIGKRVITNNIHGYLPSQMVYFLMNYHISKRRIWLTRHGESLDNLKGKLGGDSILSTDGIKFAMCLRDFFVKKGYKLKIWTSCLKRAIQTSAPIYEALKIHGKITKLSRLHSLNEIYAGTCEGMTYEEIQKIYPEEFEMRASNKMRYRYPGGGESYLDLIERLKPLIIELERETSDILIIAHNAVVRTIIGYFTDISAEELPYIEVPLNNLICLTPTPFGCDKEVFDFTKEIKESTY